MKKRFRLLLAIIVIGLLIVTINYFTSAPTIQSQSAILMDASSGKILYEKDASTSYPVASMSKLMTEYIVLDQIENGSIQWDDEVMISEVANNVIPGAITLPIDSGDTLSVRDLFSAMILSSANNAAIALAEYISGTEEAFTVLMNKKARDIGLSEKTTFVNATGLPNREMNNQENKMSATDVATLAFYLLKDHPKILETTSQQHYHVTNIGIDLYSTNKMLAIQNSKTYYESVDGLKTGYTTAAGYCFVGTALKNDKRLISVIIDAEDEEERFIETKKLLSFGFGESSIFTLKEIAKIFINKEKDV